MARVMLYISDLIVPFLIFYVVAEGLAAKRPVYDDFVKGAKDGLKTVVQILPTLVGLMVAVEYCGLPASWISWRVCWAV